MLLRTTAPIDAALLRVFIGGAVLQELALKRRRHAAAARQRDAMQRILDHVIADNFDGVMVINRAGIVVTASQMADRLLGGGEPLAGRRAGSVLPAGIEDAVSRLLSGATETPLPDGPSELTLTLDGARRTLEYVATRSEIATATSMTEIVVCLTFRDISERRRNEEHLAFLARHDGLTGALSRLPFVREMEAALASNTDRNRGLTLAILDLGRFAAVNDMLGHSFGDRVMKEVVRRLEALDLLAVGRVGGDSFAVAWRGVAEPAEARRFVQQVIATVAEP